MKKIHFFKGVNVLLISRSWPTAAQIQPEAIFSVFPSLRRVGAPSEETPRGGTVESR